MSEEEEEELEKEDMDEEDDDDEGRISFVDSTRVKTGRDLQSGNNHFFTRILFAARKQVVNSSAFRFLAEVSPDPSNPFFLDSIFRSLCVFLASCTCPSFSETTPLCVDHTW